MRLLMLIFCFCISTCAYKGKAQQKSGILATPVHCSIARGTVKQYLDYVGARSHIIIEYASNVLDVNKFAVLPESDLTIEKLLQYVLATQLVSIIERGNKLIIVPSRKPFYTLAQPSVHTFYGFVQEEVSHEPLIGATIIDSATSKGYITNSQGYYSFLATNGWHTFYIDYVGHETLHVRINLDDDIRKDHQLTPYTQTNNSITVSAPRLLKKDGAVKTYGNNKLNTDILGENDPIRERLLEPGVTSTQDINGILVRGGDPDQNLFLLDGNEVFNPTHLLGALSIVNSTSLKSMQFYKNDFPARFDGGISSVTDVYTKDGNMQQWGGNANMGLLAGAFTIEGPIAKNKLATMISFREGWPDMLLKNFSKHYDYTFRDLHMKATYLINSNNKLIANFYSGVDNMKWKDTGVDNALQKWGNRIASLRWMHILGSKAIMNLSFNSSYYKNLAGYRYDLIDSNLISSKVIYNTYSIMDHYDLKGQLELFASDKYKINTGFKVAYSKIRPFNFSIQSSLIDNPDSLTAFNPLSYFDGSIFAETEIKPGKHWLLRPGINFSMYKFKDNKFFFAQPRFFSAYQFKYNQLYASFSQTGQYLHMVSNPSLGINSNYWVPSTNLIKPVKGLLVNLGYTYNNPRGFKLNAETYWRKMNNIINYANDGNLYYAEDTWETDLQLGKGWSYGLELQLSKKLEKWQLRTVYALSWSWRKFDSINNSMKFPYKYDRRHQLNTVISYLPNKHWELSADWVFSSGDAYTLPIATNSTPQNVYMTNKVNDARTHPIHRLNIAASYQFEKNRLKHCIVLGIYNLYGSPDQYNYNLSSDNAGGLQADVPGTRLFGITPYISYTLDF